MFSDLVGDSIVAFYKQFRQFGFTAADLPICTPITTEQETAAMGAENAARPLHFVQLLPDRGHARRTSQFVERYKAKYGANQVTNAVMEAAYFQTYLLAQAIEKVGSTDTDALIFDGLARPGVQGAAGSGEDRREEPPHLAVGAHRQGARGRPVRRGLDLGGPHPARSLGRLLYPNKDCDFTNP